MHQNYYFLKQISRVLKERIIGLKMVECFSQEKDEMVLILARSRGKINHYIPFFLKAVVKPEFTCLAFPEDFDRARKNSADLFADLNDLAVIDVKQYANERAFAIRFEQNYSLVFKWFGNRSNIILVKNNEVIELFHNKLEGDNNLNARDLDRSIEQNWGAYKTAEYNHRKVFPTFGKEVNRHLDAAFESPALQEPAQRWAYIQQLVGQLENPVFHIAEVDYKPTLLLFEQTNHKILSSSTDPLLACNALYSAFSKISTIAKEKGDVLRILYKRKQRTENYVSANLEKLDVYADASRYERIANVLMAFLHQIPEKAERVELQDFYTDKPIVIKLKSDLSPQKNAENYYRKAKNERIESEKVQESTQARIDEIEELKRQIETIEAVETLRELRKYLKAKPVQNDTQAQTPAQLFRSEVFENYTILIGRNAKNNDILTKQFARKDDLWLHARDVSGSHVVVKAQAGRKTPNSVIERAAQIAAWNSKRRNDTLCPVIVTPKKYVRKPKGLPDGAVIVEREEVVMVQPAP